MGTPAFQRNTPSRSKHGQLGEKPSRTEGLKLKWCGIIIRPFFPGHCRENLTRKGVIDDEDEHN